MLLHAPRDARAGTPYARQPPGAPAGGPLAQHGFHGLSVGLGVSTGGLHGGEGQLGLGGWHQGRVGDAHEGLQRKSAALCDTDDDDGDIMMAHSMP